MKEINLGKVLVEHRRQAGITQDELAAFLGVSKAAVSKWETGTTYPDITLLPLLASFFNIRIDELLDYQPQLTVEESRRLYARLSGEFSSLPFSAALEHCRNYIRRYYSCFPLLFHLGSLLVNHCMLAESAEQQKKLLEEAAGLFCRVRTKTGDVQLGREALHMEAYCLLILKRPEEVLKLLEGGSLYSSPKEPLLSSAYEMTGQKELSLPNREAFDKTVQRILKTAEAFDLKTLHPSLLLSAYLSIAQNCAALGEDGQTMEFLELYTDLACGDIYPLHLHGDSYFDLLDGWIRDNLFLGDSLPREESLIRHSMTQALTENPAFAGLSCQPRFQELVRRLKINEEEKRHGGC